MGVRKDNGAAAEIEAGGAATAHDDDAADSNNDDAGGGQDDPNEDNDSEVSADDATASQDDEDIVDVESSGPEVEDGGDIDEQDGVRTNSFNAMPSELGDMRLVSSESDPSEHIIQVDYMATDEESRMLFMAYIPGTEGDGYAPVSSHSDPGFRSAVDSGKQHFEEEGFDVTSRSAATDGYD